MTQTTKKKAPRQGAAINRDIISQFLNLFKVKGTQTRVGQFDPKRSWQKYNGQPLAGKKNYYFTINPRQLRGISSNSQGGKDHISHVVSLYADIDTGTAGHKKPSHFDTTDEALEFLKDFDPIPSIVVSSGHGLQAYWLLDEPERLPEDKAARGKFIAKYEAANDQLQTRVHADSTQDINRVFRLPNTINHKDNTEPVKCTIIQSDNGKRYTLDDFAVKEQQQQKTLTEAPTNQNISDNLISKLEEFDNAPDKSAAYMGIINSLVSTGWNDVKKIHDFVSKHEPIREWIRSKKHGINYTKGAYDKAIAFVSKKEQPKQQPQQDKINLFDKKYHSTDMGNALRFVDYSQDHVRHCAPMGSWFIWQGNKWARDIHKEIIVEAQRLVEEMYKQAIQIPTEKEDARKAALKHTMKSENTQFLKRMLEQATGHLKIHPDDLDKHIYLINTPDGTIDIRTGTARPPRREDFITKELKYKMQTGRPERWLDFLEQTFQGDTELISWLQKALGYSLTGDIGEQCLFILYGDGNNGKSVFMNLYHFLLGDYARNTSPSTLMIKKYDHGATQDLAVLNSARYVNTFEVGDGKKLDEARVKALTGGDPITARFLYANDITYIPEFKIWLSTNHKPRIEGTDDGIWRRIKLIPFNYKVPDAKKIQNFEKILLEEEGGKILNWAVEGANDWYKNHLGDDPEQVQRATNSYRKNSDAIGLFLKDITQPCEGAGVRKQELYLFYKKWADFNNEKKYSFSAFGKALEERRIFTTRGEGGRYFLDGITLSDNSQSYAELS